jgi:ring-1,2-phenylacetyl-CoA epoxidase subunit PaaE
LQAALDQGIALPYSCKGGVCSTCVARCVAGRVRMSKNDVLMEDDLRAGLVLTCVGYAETDLELELEDNIKVIGSL